jgi:hypothetical protein
MQDLDGVTECACSAAKKSKTKLHRVTKASLIPLFSLLTRPVNKQPVWVREG